MTKSKPVVLGNYDLSIQILQLYPKLPFCHDQDYSHNKSPSVNNKPLAKTRTWMVSLELYVGSIDHFFYVQCYHILELQQIVVW
jgi:hypothetical protein